MRQPLVEPTAEAVLALYQEERPEEALSALVHRYLDVVRAAVERRLRPQRGWSRLWAQREDLAHDALLRAHRALLSEEHRSRITDLDGWVLHTAYFELGDSMRRAGRRDSREPLSFDGDPPEPPPSASNSPGDGTLAESLDLRRALEDLRACIAALDARLKETITLWLEGLPLQDIALAVGMATFGGAAKARDRAIDALAQCLRRKGWPILE